MPDLVSETLSVCTEFDIFAETSVQKSLLETIETIYNLIAFMDKSNLEFMIPADNDTYIDLNIRVYIRGKLTAADGTDFTIVTNNFLHSLFSQCSIILNGVTITQASDLYQYRSYRCPKSSIDNAVLGQLQKVCYLQCLRIKTF